jgi:hypothetical protein
MRRLNATAFSVSLGILALCSVALAVGNYTSNGDGTVTDNDTGLMWWQAGSQDLVDWEPALTYCEDSTHAGYTDWRLPNIKELQSLVDHSRTGPAWDTNYFSGSTGRPYWSSTSRAFNPYYAWAVSFHAGLVDESDKDTSGNYVRCVRGGLTYGR